MVALGGAAVGGVVNIIIRGVDKFSKTFAGAEKKLGGFMNTIQQNQSAILGLGAGLTAVGVAGAIAFGKTAKAASDLEEIQSKFNVVFGKFAPEAEAMTKVLQKDYLLSETAAKKALSSFQDLFVPLGFTREEASGLSGDLVKLTADVGSFNNMPTAEVQRDFQSALVGNHEAVRKYGIIITEATLKQKAYELGIDNVKEKNGKLVGTLTALEKVQVRQALLYDMTSDAQGDVARTSDSYANKVKALKADMEDLQTEIGTAVLPIFSALIDKLSILTNWFGALNPNVQKFIIIAAGVVTVLALIGGPLLILIAMLPALATNLGLISAGLTAVSIAGAPVWLIILAIIAAVALVIGIIMRWSEIMDFMQNRLDSFKKGLEIFKTAALLVWEAIKLGVMVMANVIINAYEKMANNVIGAINKIIDAYNRIPFVKNIDPLKNVSFDSFKFNVDATKAKISGLSTEIKGLTGEFIDLQKEGVSKFGQIFTGSPNEGTSKKLGGALDTSAANDAATIQNGTNTSSAFGTGNVTNVNMQGSNIYGTDPNEMVVAFQDELDLKMTNI